MDERLIFHVDVNSAFLSWEATRRVSLGMPDLRLIPSAVGGDPSSRRSIITAKSIPAKKYDIRTGEPVSMALRKCPDLVIVPPNFSLYHECSNAFMNICREYAPVVEQASIDECYLDMTGTSLIYKDPIALAYLIKDRIRDELGFTVNVGIGNNKLCAKMASDFEKPDKVHTLFKDEIKSKMWPLSIGDLFLCGKSAASRLRCMQINTIGDLARSDLSYIQSLIGEKSGLLLYQFANGFDDSVVSDERDDAKSYGMSKTLEDDVVSIDRANEILLMLTDNVSRRLRSDNVMAGCVGITIRSTDFKNKSHQRKLFEATDITSEIYEVAKELFKETWDGKTPLRLLNVTLSDITTDDNHQMTLFSDEAREKSRKMDKTADAIRDRFGSNILKRGNEL